VNRFLIILLGLLVGATGLAAQPAVTAGLEVMRGEDGTVVQLDTSRISHTGPSAFVVWTIVRFPQAMRIDSGLPVDREVDVEELDCAGNRTRGLWSLLQFDAAVLRRVELTRTWTAVPPERRPLFETRCAYLLHSPAAGQPLGYELSAVDQGPEISNQDAVASTLAREYAQAIQDSTASGVTMVRMRIGADGVPDRTTIRVAAGSEAAFDRVAVRLAQMMRFRPARVGNAAVPVWVTLPVTFGL
jgi:TonB family protein